MDQGSKGIDQFQSVPREPSPGPPVLVGVFAVAGLGAIAAAYYGVLGQGPSAPSIDCARELRRAISLADALMGMLYGLAGLALYRRSPRAALFSVLAGTMLWCRVAQDRAIHFGQAHADGFVRPSLSFEVGIDLLIVTFAVSTVVWGWRHWRVSVSTHVADGALGANSRRPTSLTALAMILILASVGITAAWIGWFTTGRDALVDQPCLVAFADSLFLAEELIAFAAALGGIGIFCGRPWSLLWSLTTSGGLAYVASVEALFFALNLNPDTPQAGLGPTLIILLATTSILAVVVPWRQRSWFVGKPSRLANNHSANRS